MISSVQVQRGRYYDSVRLMQASRALQAVDGVADALAAMATELNLGLVADMGFDLSGVGDVSPNDLLIAVRATAESVLSDALTAFETALEARSTSEASLAGPSPKRIGSAAAGANVALISVPGDHAFVEAMDALRSGLHVMVFSDNVPIEHELALKRYGTEHGLLVMGPDCGTSIVNGLGLGFANATESGPVGIVGASGTGIQELCCLLDDGGVGVRHALGTGSRDLSEPVGGFSTLQALSALDADPATELIAVISKPPAPTVARRVESAAASCSTPVVLTFMGEATIESGALAILDILGIERREPASWTHGDPIARPGSLRGLFSGGTLRDDSRFIAAERLGPIGTHESDPGHTFVDYGDDDYTRGRAHPMIDQTVRLDRLEAASADPTVGVVLVDVVLGYGANPDPAAELAPAVRDAVNAGLGVVVSLCGTRGDPQRRDDQALALHSAGASVYVSNAAATAAAVDLVGEGSTP